MKRKTKTPSLIHKTACQVRFSEVDMMNIAWHGSYIKYLEDGREDFGARFGIGYMDIYRAGYKAPVVDLKIEYKKAVGVGDRIWIETRYVHTEAAKIYFDYIIYNEAEEIVVTAYTVQVFLDENDRLVLQNPEFYTEWKERWNIL